MNIEDLLNVLAEIKQKHHNKLYPFIGSWNVHLLKVAGEDFDKVTRLDKLIRKQLFNWINIRDYDKCNYFAGFHSLANEIGSALRVFTLNYDLCVEKALAKENAQVELGFDENRDWEASNFDADDNSDNSVYLYKLHGSIDWIRENEKGQVLKKCDSPQENPELIFGTTAKLSSIDPYLFYVHEFRKYSLQHQLRFIVTVGYSFGDEYVNRLIGQAMMRNKFVNLLTVFPTFCQSDKDSANTKLEEERQRVSRLIDTDESRIIVEDATAKEFFESKSNLTYFDHWRVKDDEDPF